MTLTDALAIWVAFQNMNSLGEADQKLRTDAWHMIYRHGEQALRKFRAEQALSSDERSRD